MGSVKLRKEIFDAKLARELGKEIKQVYPPFQVKPFVNKVAAQVAAFGLQDRVAVFAKALQNYLPEAFPDALRVLMGVLEKVDGKEGAGYGLVPVADFVGTYGQEHFDLSMAALGRWQRRATGHTRWIVRHALKRPAGEGHAGAQALLAEVESRGK